jgi:hypothetical protein
MQQGITQAIIVAKDKFRANQTTERIALFDEDRNPIGPNSDTGESVLLTGYEPQEAANLEPEDTVNVAFAKLEARIAELEAKVNTTS